MEVEFGDESIIVNTPLLSSIDAIEKRRLLHAGLSLAAVTLSHSATGRMWQRACRRQGRSRGGRGRQFRQILQKGLTRPGHLW